MEEKVDIGTTTKMTGAWLIIAALEKKGREFTFNYLLTRATISLHGDRMNYHVPLPSRSVDFLYGIEFPLRVKNVSILVNGFAYNFNSPGPIKRISFERLRFGNTAAHIDFDLDPTQFADGKVPFDKDTAMAHDVGFH